MDSSHSTHADRDGITAWAVPYDSSSACSFVGDNPRYKKVHFFLPQLKMFTVVTFDSVKLFGERGMMGSFTLIVQKLFGCAFSRWIRVWLRGSPTFQEQRSLGGRRHTEAVQNNLHMVSDGLNALEPEALCRPDLIVQ